jgi:hypothetical protein
MTARISVEQRRLVADIKPLGQEGQKEFVPTVFGRGVAEGVDDLGHQDLKAVVPDPSGADGKDEVNDEQLRRGEGLKPRNRCQPMQGAEEGVEAKEGKDEEDDISEGGDGAGMTRIADQLHHRDPIGIGRKEQQP